MKIKYLIILFVQILLVELCQCQEINWKTTRNWKFYNILDRAGMKVSPDSLQYIKYIELNQDTMRTFLESATIWPIDKYSVWMGDYVVSCESDDKKFRKIIISTYGGFLYDYLSKRYYQISNEYTKSWLAFLIDCSIQVSKK
jgi:hypothetical protein